MSLSYAPPLVNVILLVTGDEQHVNQRATMLGSGSRDGDIQGEKIQIKL